MSFRNDCSFYNIELILKLQYFFKQIVNIWNLVLGWNNQQDEELLEHSSLLNLSLDVF